MTYLVSGVVANDILSSAKQYEAKAVSYLQRRFWSRVNGYGSDCWVWTGHIGIHGTGTIQFNNRRIEVQALAYVWTRGKVPDGQFVFQDCGNKLCVNPRHLTLRIERSRKRVNFKENYL